MAPINDAYRFTILTVSIWTAVIISTTYAFSIVSNTLKVRYDLSQADMTTVSTVGAFFGMCSFPAGMLFDYAGPRWVLVMAFVMTSIGFFGLTALLEDWIHGNLVILCVFNTFISMGTGWMDVGSLMTCMLQFPRDRGAVVSIQKTFMGLGSTVLVTLYITFFESAVSHYTMFVGALTVAVGIVAVWLLELPPYYLTARQKQKAEAEGERQAHSQLVQQWKVQYETPSLPAQETRRKQSFLIGYAVLLSMLVFLTAFNIIVVYVDTTHAFNLGCCIAAMSLLMSFAAMPLWSWSQPTAPTTTTTSSNSAKEEEQQADDHHSHGEDNDATRLLPPPSNHETSLSSLVLPQYTSPFRANIKSPLLWCLWFTSYVNLGTGITIVLNGAQIYRALNENVFDVSGNSLIVALIGVSSGVARISVGLLDTWQTHHNTPILREMAPSGTTAHHQPSDSTEGKVAVEDHHQPPSRSQLRCITVAYPLSSLFGVLALLLFLVMPTSAAPLPFSVLAFAYGLGWGCTALCVRCMFAVDVGKHYNFCFVGAMAAAITLNRLLFGTLYDQEGSAQHLFPFCAGIVCIRTACIVMLALNVASCGTAWFVHYQYSKLVHGVRLVPAPWPLQAPSTGDGALQEGSV